MTLVGQIMSRQVITVQPDTTLAAAVKFLTENHIGSAPVVDDGGQIVGMISELQLLEVVFDLEAHKAPVSNYMIEEVQSVASHDSLAHVAQLFALYSFRRLPVVENGYLVGIVTRRDLMNHSLRTGERLTEPLEKLIPGLVQVT